LISPLYGFVYRERCEKFCKPFDLSNLSGGGTGIALESWNCEFTHGNVNSKNTSRENLWHGVSFGLIVVLWLFGVLT
jgi:hypothetical protein